MPITATIQINVPALPDNDVWFANAAAWTNYWTDITGDVTLDAIATTIYAATPYNVPGTDPYVLDVDGIEYRLATEAMINSLVARVQTLNDSYELLRNELKNAGLITNAQ